MQGDAYAAKTYNIRSEAEESTKYTMPYHNGEEMQAYASEPVSNVEDQAQTALKVSVGTNELLNELFQRLQPVMKDPNAALAKGPASMTSVDVDFDPSSKVAQQFKQLAEDHRNMQNKIEFVLSMLEI